MKNYHDYPSIELGCSDIAEVIVKTSNVTMDLHFGEDGSYVAYLVDGDAEIGAHYSLVYEEPNCAWLKVYDDDEKTIDMRVDGTLKIYRAGNFGCIIQIIKK